LSEIYASAKLKALREPPLQYATEYLRALQFAAGGRGCTDTGFADPVLERTRKLSAK
jgi:hypothetical protein